MYRYSAPQKGRYREHWQVSVEAIGSDDPALDAEVIQLYDAWLGRLGITDYRLELNSIGDRNCRPAYLERLTRWLEDHDADLDDEARAKRATSPLRVFDNFDAKPADVRAALAEAPKIGESLCDACREHFAAVCSILDAYGVAYDLVPTLVRGLDYYTRTTWEFVGPALGAQSTLSGEDATTTWWRRSAALGLLVLVSEPASSGSVLPSRRPGWRSRRKESTSSSATAKASTGPRSWPRWPSSGAPAGAVTRSTRAARTRGS